MGAAIRDSEVFGIEDCGHLATLEAPAEVNRILTTWFSR
jgi:pimeloyl-ACP methyl ester carboxylesterase